jgi:hypothetical protein
MASVFEVMAKLSANTANFDAGMSKAAAAVEKVDKAASKTGGSVDKNITKQADKATGGMGKLKGAFVAAAAAGAAFAAVNYVKSAVGAASAFEAEFIGVEQTFGSAAQVVKDFAENAAATAGLSETAALRYAKSFGGFATSAGLAGDAQAKFSTSLVQTAGDLGSFFDLPTEDALNAISQGLRGEYEGLRRFNILLDDHTLKQIAMNEGIFNGTGEMTQQQKVLARQTAILQQVGVAQNDFTNYSDTYGNSIKTVGALMQNLTADVGAALLPAMAGLAQAVIPVVEQLGPVLSRVIESLIPTIEALADTIEPLIMAIEPLFEALDPLLTVFSLMIEKLLPPLVEIIAMVSESIGNLVVALEPLMTTLVNRLAADLENIVVPVIQFLVNAIDDFLIPIIEALNPIVMGLYEVFKTFILPVLQDVITFIETHLPAIQDTFEQVFEAVAMAVTWAWDNVLQPVFGGIMDFFRDVLGIDLGQLSKIGEAFARGFEKQKLLDKISKADLGDQTEIWDIATNTGIVAGTNVAEGMATSLAASGAGGQKVRDAWTELFQGFTDDLAKQEAKITLASLGLTNGLIEKILGDADWQKIYQRVVKGGEKTAKNLQNSFNKTTDGLEEIADAAKEAQDELDKINEKLADYIDKTTTFNKKLTDLFKSANPFAQLLDKRGEFERNVSDTFTSFYQEISDGLKSGLFDDAVSEELSLLTAEYEKQLSTIAKRVDEINTQLEELYVIREAARAYQDGMRGILEATLPLSRVEMQIGRFEAQVVSSFDAINTKIEDGLNIGLLTETVATQLRATASQTRATVMSIAKQRDALAKTYDELVQRLQASRDFRQATKDALLGVANITTIGKSARTMIRNLSKTLERTETFRNQLSTLQQMGLNKEAYNQIVNSGLDAGTATAKALLRGGPEAVDEINNLFTNLELSANALATDAEVFMFDGGEQTIQGFIEGIIAQDEKLRQVALAEATAFNTTFQNTIDAAQANLDATILSLEGEKDTLIASATTLATAFATQFQAIVDAAFATAQAQITEAQAQAQQAVDAANAAVAAAQAQAQAAAESSQTISAGVGSTTTSGTSSSVGGSVVTPGVVTSTAGVVIPELAPNQINVTINAGLGTSGAAVGQQVTKVLTQYARTSGGGGGRIQFL